MALLTSLSDLRVLGTCKATSTLSRSPLGRDAWRALPRRVGVIHMLGNTRESLSHVPLASFDSGTKTDTEPSAGKARRGEASRAERPPHTLAPGPAPVGPHRGGGEAFLRPFSKRSF